jgi:cytochrome bd-type quinol oxidase subunit 1
MDKWAIVSLPRSHLLHKVTGRLGAIFREGEFLSIGNVTKLQAKRLQLLIVECEMMMMMMMMMMMIIIIIIIIIIITRRKKIMSRKLLLLQDRGHYTCRCSPFPSEISR